MSEYIEREKAIEAVGKYLEPNAIGETLKTLLWVLPSADVQPVVRCKDCYHYPNPYADCPMIGWARNEDDYCSKAERKGTDNEVN